MANIDIKFTHDSFGIPDAVTNILEHQRLASYLASDLQTVNLCNAEIEWLESFQAGDKRYLSMSGNNTLRKLDDNVINLYTSFAFSEGDYGAPLTLLIEDVKQLIRDWREHLKKPRPKRN
ncbi:MAG: hypothetical protein RLP44_01645 [Aggregatilineales bacterium]